MSTLDNNLSDSTFDESTVPFLPTAMRIGLIGGLVAVVFGLISHMTGLSVPNSIMKSLGTMVLSMGIYAVIGGIAIRKHRMEDLNGFISFGRAFKVSLIAMVIAGVMGTLFNVLYMTVIDPGFIDTMVDGMEEMFASMGLEGDIAEQELDKVRERFAPMTQLTNGLLFGTLAGVVLSLIIAAIMKKNPPVV